MVSYCECLSILKILFKRVHVIVHAGRKTQCIGGIWGKDFFFQQNYSLKLKNDYVCIRTLENFRENEMLCK